MGYGSWTRESFVNYSRSRGRTVDAAGRLDSRLNDRQIFTQSGIHRLLDPKNVMRECCDCEEHPRSIPVILALDVTGSMGSASAEVARRMNEVMTELYKRISGIEFMIMGIGDLSYDRAPIQISQFESDIRIAQQLDLVYMEHGGGGNAFESYTAAWYMGLNHCRLDAWKRGEKGLIITMGDEPMNPYLPGRILSELTGDGLQGDVETAQLYAQVSEKYELYHLHVIHDRQTNYLEAVEKSFGRLLPQGHLSIVGLEGIAEKLISIITDFAEKGAREGQNTGTRAMIAWDTDGGKAGAPASKEDEGGKERGLFIRW